MKKKEIRIPTLLGLLVLLLGITGGIWLVVNRQSQFSQASGEEQPHNLILTNVSDTSFTVSWVTDKPVAGVIQSGTSPSALNQTTADDRDQTGGSVRPYATHHVTIGKFHPLLAATAYYFVIQSGSTTFDSHGQPYQIKTAPTLTATSTPSDALSGKVVAADGSPAGEAILYATLDGGAPLSTLVTSAGNWIIPISGVRTQDLSGYLTYDSQGARAAIQVQTAGNVTTQALTTLANARPAPTMTIGQTYDWTTIGTTGNPGPIAAASASPSASPESSHLPTSVGFLLEPLASPSASNRQVTIVTPAGNETVNTNHPAVIGTGPKNTKISITVQSAVSYSGTAIVAADGTWEWDVPSDLAPGHHTITVTYTDPLGQLQRVTRQFVVLAADNGNPAIVATPSATLAPTPLPTRTPLPTKTPVPTPTPRLTPLPTEIPSLTPIPTPYMPATGSGVPTPGLVTPTLIFILAGLLLTLTGFFSLIRISI
jgi:hypothetical protein